MKQFLLLSTLVLLTTIGAMISPFWPLLLYYGLAVMRPQALWNWALPMEVRWSLVAACLLFLSVFLHLSGLFKRIRLTPVLIALMGFSICLLLSTLTAYDTHSARVWGMEYAKVLLVAVLAMLVIERLWQIRAMALMIMVGVGYVAYTFNYQYLFEGYRMDIFHRGYAGLDNNGAGLMMAMGIPIAYAFAMGAGGPGRLWLRIAAAAAGLFMIHATMLSYSRGAMVAGCAGLLWLACRHTPRWQAAGGAVILVVAMAVLAGPEIRQEFLSAQHYDTDPSAQSRFVTWSAAWAITMDHPILGTGIRNSPLLIQNYGTQNPNRTVHNQYLQISADSGIPALALYLTIVGIAFYNLGSVAKQATRTLKNQKELDPDVQNDLRQSALVCIGLQTSLVTFLVGGVFLSLEVFEFAWLLIVLGAVVPTALRNRLQQTEPEELTPGNEPEPWLVPGPKPTSHQPLPAGLRLRGA
ncbi:O-antigen ligase family protein [Mucisphaera sp.]|uniref:O-antigen ligase family protein n=1 Tax=Mucisphaera sp. TaxID=2913024 RepID=UPI003D0D5F36